MKYNPLVSIIIPVYNGSNYMAEAIESALNQTYKNIEVIVVNDGSKDGGKTDAIAKSFLPRIKYIDKQNGGVGSAINEGIRQMKGEYASWLSHDDLYHLNKIERQVCFLNEIIEENKGEAFNDLIYSATETINAKGEVILRKKCLQDKVQTPILVFSKLSQFNVCGCATLIPKSLFDEIGLFDESLKTVQDVDFWYRILLRGHKYYYQNEYLVQNRRHPGQTSRVLSREWLNEIENFDAKLIKEVMSNHYINNDKSALLGMGEYFYTRGSLGSRKVYNSLVVTSSHSYFKSLSFRCKCLLWCIKRVMRNIAKFLYNKLIVNR